MKRESVANITAQQGQAAKIKRLSLRYYSMAERSDRFHMVSRVTGKNLKEIIRENVGPDAHIMTDSHHGYHGVGKEFASHETVNHAVHENARDKAHVNTDDGI